MFFVEPFTLVIPHKLDGRADWLDDPEEQEDLAVRLSCPECKDPYPNIELEFSTGDVVCRGCGLVFIDRIVDTRPQWLTYDNDRKEEEQTHQEPQEETTQQDEDSSNEAELECWSDDGFDTTPHDNCATPELEQHQPPSLPSQNIPFQLPLSSPKTPAIPITIPAKIHSICIRHSLSESVSKIARLLYQRFGGDRALRTKRLDAVIAACIFIACRAESVPRSFKEIAKFNKVPKRQVSDCYNVLKAALNKVTDEAITASELAELSNMEPSGIEAVSTQNLEVQSAIRTTNKVEMGNRTRPENLLPYYCDSLQLPLQFLRDCEAIYSRMHHLNIASVNAPASVASGIIYFAMKLRGYDISLSKIEQTTGVASDSILLIHQLLMKKRAILVGPEAENFSSMKRRNERSSKRLMTRVPKPDSSQASFHDNPV